MVVRLTCPKTLQYTVFALLYCSASMGTVALKAMLSCMDTGWIDGNFFTAIIGKILYTPLSIFIRKIYVFCLIFCLCVQARSQNLEKGGGAFLKE